MRVHISDYQSFNTNLITLHAGHGEALAPSLADAAFLHRTKPRGVHTVLFGDINVDMLPTLEVDPWAEMPARSTHCCFERDLLQTCLNVMEIEVQIPERSHGVPGGRRKNDKQGTRWVVSLNVGHIT